MAGHRRAEATPSFGRVCPAMTKRKRTPRMKAELFDLNGKVAIVTGGNGGIGLGMARGLAAAGAAGADVARHQSHSGGPARAPRRRRRQAETACRPLPPEEGGRGGDR